MCAAAATDRRWTRVTIVTGKSMRGFTLIELMVVMLIVAILAGLVAPSVVNSLDKARESALQENLHVMRKLLDDYYADKGRYPDALDELVEQRYVRSIPRDPFTESQDSWVFTYDDDGGISDIHSGYDGVARDGSYIRQW